MYRCSNIHVFDEPVIKTIHHLDPPGDERWAVCPECGNDNLTEVVKCKCCDRSIQIDLTDEYIEFKNGDIICNDCLRDYFDDNDFIFYTSPQDVIDSLSDLELFKLYDELTEYIQYK